MNKTEALSVEAEAPDGAFMPAIFLIADDGVTRLANMDADLIFASRLKPDAEQTPVIAHLRYLEMGDSALALLFIFCHAHREVRLFDKVTFPLAFELFHLALYNGNILALNGMREKLLFQMVARLFSVGENQNPGRIPIKPMDGIDHPCSSSFQDLVDANRIPFVESNAEQPLGFVEDNQIAIFKKNLYIFFEIVVFFADRDLRADAYEVMRLPHSSAIDLNATL